MATLPPSESFNPFEAPTTKVGLIPGFIDPDFASDGAEAIRQAHIGHEVSVKSLGLLYYLGTFFGVIGTISNAAMAFGLLANARNADPAQQIALWVSLVVSAALTVLYGALGYGLRALHPWARWTALVLDVLGLIYGILITVGGLFFAAMGAPNGAAVLPVVGAIVILITGYILYLLVAPKAGMIFSPQYKAIIRATPHIKYRTSTLAKIVLFIFLAIVIGAVAIAFLGLGG